MKINTIYNEDCFNTMRRMISEGQLVDIILTSPPYCTESDSANKFSDYAFANNQVRYDVFEGFDNPDEYRKWTIDLFNLYYGVLADYGVVLYNISYSAGNPDLMWLCMADVMNYTNFRVVDCIVWKKHSALPQNINNRATRICEFVFVFCKKGHENTFHTNKQRVGNKFKNLFTNFIEAPNNDILDKSINTLNNATFSTQFVTKLLNNYADEGALVYDSFMGTGTTALACKQSGRNYIGSELSTAQVEFANIRLSGINRLMNQNVKKLF